MPPSVLAVGGRVGSWAKGAGDFLKSAPRGAYTTARTCGVTRVFDFEEHVRRTHKSALAMGMRPDAGVTEEHLRADMQSSFAGVIHVLQCQLVGRDWASRLDPGAALHGNEGEIKLTSVLLWGEDVCREARALFEPHLVNPSPLPGEHFAGCLLLTHATPLPPRRTPPIKVLVRGAPRHNAAAKDSAWVTDRLALEAAQPKDVEELLLSNESGILEGTQTNFFAVVGGRVQTAEEGVLAGTVRTFVFEACAQLGIPVDCVPPKVSDAVSGQWDGAFLSSTSRLVLPIDSLDAGDGTVVELGGAKCVTVRRIEEAVAALIASNSTDVFA
jgi:branched-subunit amino acid aminotransferase/4-amino-4-deoxychorismate lyase